MSSKQSLSVLLSVFAFKRRVLQCEYQLECLNLVPCRGRQIYLSPRAPCSPDPGLHKEMETLQVS